MENIMSPFNGVFINRDGNYQDLATGQIVMPGELTNGMSPFNGWFFAADGSLHNISELSAGGDASAAILAHNNSLAAHAVLIAALDDEIAGLFTKMLTTGTGEV